MYLGCPEIGGENGGLRPAIFLAGGYAAATRMGPLK